jgi:hypothetical protein
MIAFHPADWAKKQVGLLISAEKIGVRNWIKSVCDKHVIGRSGFDDEEDLYWGSWRAPKFIHMEPAGNTAFDATKAWNREELVESERLLDKRAERFVTFLVLDLETIAGAAHVEMAKRVDSSASASRTEPAREEPPHYQKFGPGRQVADTASTGTSQDALPESDDRSEQRKAVIMKVRNPERFTFLSIAEATLYFSVKARTIYRWVECGKLRNGGRRGAVTIDSINRFEKTRSRKRRSAS